MGNRFWDDIFSAEKLIIYGAGCYGRTMLEFFKSINLLNEKVLAVVVTKLEKKECIEGIWVEEITNLKHLKHEKVVIAVSEEKRAEIINILHQYGFTNYVMTDEIHIRIMRSHTNSIHQDETAKKQIRESRLYLEELRYGQNFDRVIADSEWLKKKDFAAGGMAVSNKYLYMLFKILDSGRFSSFLDIGMGQTTKMISQYVNHNTGVNHTVVENDLEWISFFSDSVKLGNQTEVKVFEYIFEDFRNQKVRVYERFNHELSGRKFDFISIDAPFGGDMKEFSRVDVLKIMPMCLKDSWIIMMDDVHRVGEKNSYHLLLDILKKNGVKYESQVHHCGDRDFAIITSVDNRFFCKI